MRLVSVKHRPLCVNFKLARSETDFAGHAANQKKVRNSQTGDRGWSDQGFVSMTRRCWSRASSNKPHMLGGAQMQGARFWWSKIFWFLPDCGLDVVALTFLG